MRFNTAQLEERDALLPSNDDFQRLDTTNRNRLGQFLTDLEEFGASGRIERGGEAVPADEVDPTDEVVPDSADES